MSTPTASGPNFNTNPNAAAGPDNLCHVPTPTPTPTPNGGSEAHKLRAAEEKLSALLVRRSTKEELIQKNILLGKSLSPGVLGARYASETGVHMMCYVRSAMSVRSVMCLYEE